MSGRPTDPSFTAPAYTVLDHAPDTNYPAGPNTWNGNPTKVDPPGRTSVGISPAQGNAAQYHNFLHNAWSTGLNAAKTYAAALRSEVLSWATAMQSYAGQVGALNWSPSAGANLVKVAHDGVSGVWYAACSTANSISYSGDGGRSWTDLVVGAAGATSTIGVDTSGNVVAVPASTSLYEYDRATGVWTTRAAALSAAPTTSALAYEPTAALWCAAYVNGATKYISTSANRALWSAQTAPSNMGTTVLDLGAAPGKLVLLSVNLNGDYFLSSSADGGVNWTADQTISLTSTAGLTPKGSVAYSADLSLWMVAVGNGTQSKLYTSADGTTWTLLKDWSNASLHRVAVVGRLWALSGGISPSSIGNVGALLFSYDSGATWRRGASFQVDPTAMRGGTGGFVVIVNAGARGAFVTGDTSAAAIT